METDTPETDEQIRNWREAGYTTALLDDFARKLELERDDAIAEATNAVNDIIAVRHQRDQLAEALMEMRYGHTDKAESMAIAALAYLENAKEEARRE